MKIKKEYILLGLLMASSIGYLVFQKTDRIHYALPALAELKADDITVIEIIRYGKTSTLRKEGKVWLISPQNWRADLTKVSEMLDTLARLKVTDLVSESGDYDRYQLDAKGKALLKAYAGKELRLELTVGKAAPTYNHTYIMLPGDERVYLAGGDLPRLFLVPVPELRDMVVFAVSPPEISRIEIERGTGKTVLTKSELAQEAPKNVTSGEKTKLFTWMNDKGTVVDKADIDSFLSALSKVYCGEYLDDAMRPLLKSPLMTVRLIGPGEHSLSVYQKEGDKIPALSSENASPFVLPDYKFEEMEKSINKILEK
jgi:hypothetical protein